MWQYQRGFLCSSLPHLLSFRCLLPGIVPSVFGSGSFSRDGCGTFRACTPLPHAPTQWVPPAPSESMPSLPVGSGPVPGTRSTAGMRAPPTGRRPAMEYLLFIVIAPNVPADLERRNPWGHLFCGLFLQGFRTLCLCVFRVFAVSSPVCRNRRWSTHRCYKSYHVSRELVRAFWHDICTGYFGKAFVPGSVAGHLYRALCAVGGGGKGSALAVRFAVSTVGTGAYILGWACGLAWL